MIKNHADTGEDIGTTVADRLDGKLQHDSRTTETRFVANDSQSRDKNSRWSS